MLLFASCGQQHDAEVLVKDFMKQYMKSDLAITGRHFTHIDSTTLLSDSIINRLRLSAKNALRYQRNIPYQYGKATKPLYVVRVKYHIDTTAYSDTYYLNHELTDIVAFKEN